VIVKFRNLKQRKQMKNTIKMSLAAALAVSALSTTASAGNLEEMIKDVTMSGKMEVEYETSQTTTGGVDSAALEGNRNNWDYDFDAKFKMPVNDSVTAELGLQADHEYGVNQDSANGNLNVSSLNFTYVNGPVTAIVGRQGIGAPWFDDAKGNGVKALVAAGPVTLAAAHFTGTTSDALTSELEQSDISAVAAIASVGPVNVAAWYAQLQGITNTLGTGLRTDADSYTVNVKGTFGPVKVCATHTQADYDLDLAGAVDPEASLTKLSVSADMGMVAPYVAYAMTNDDDTSAAARGEGVDLDEGDASTNFKKNILSLDDYNDADAYLIGTGVKMDALSLDVYYLAGDTTTGTVTTDFSEMGLGAKYQMSKNFAINSYYATAELDNTGNAADTESDVAEIALEYKF
jgi:hypothetical protein